MAQQTADIKFLISGIIDGIWGEGIMPTIPLKTLMMMLLML